MTTQLIIFDNAFEEFIMERKLAVQSRCDHERDRKNCIFLGVKHAFSINYQSDSAI